MKKISFHWPNPSSLIGRLVLPQVLESQLEKKNEREYLEPLHIDEMSRDRPGRTTQERNEILSILAKRADRLTEHMIWSALRNKLEHQVGNNGLVVIDYKIPPENQPVVSVPWTSKWLARPDRDLQACIEGLGEDASPLVVMNTNTYEAGDGKLLSDMANDKTLIRYDGGYRSETPNPIFHKYIEDGEVFVFDNKQFPGYLLEGEVKLAADDDEWLIEQGPLALRCKIGDNIFLRAVAWRVPVLDHADHFFRLKAY